VILGVASTLAALIKIFVVQGNVQAATMPFDLGSCSWNIDVFKKK
jgi:hypothetical protein